MKVIGHRGAAGLAPENTFAAFDLALALVSVPSSGSGKAIAPAAPGEKVYTPNPRRSSGNALGVDGLETDVQKTKDGKLVLFHSELLDRTTNGTGRLQDTSWHELQQLDAGSWFNPKFTGERVPLLLEALEKYGRRTTFDLEVKQSGIEYEVLDMVEQLDLLDRVAFTSHDFSILSHIKERNPLAQVGYLTADVSEENLQRFLRANMRYFCPRAQTITEELVDQWHSSGLFVRACGVSNTELMKKVIQAGVDGMTFDYPDILLKELGRL